MGRQSDGTGAPFSKGAIEMTTEPMAEPSADHVPERIASWAERLAMLMLLAMAALVVLQVVARDVLHLGLAWADELARYAGLAVVYLTVPLLLLQNKHVAVDIVVTRLRGVARGAVEFINELLMLAFCVLFLWGGWAFIQRAGRFATPALGMPNTLFYLPVMAGMVLLCAASVIRLVRLAGRLRGGRPDATQGPAPSGRPLP